MSTSSSLHFGHTHARFACAPPHTHTSVLKLASSAVQKILITAMFSQGTFKLYCNRKASSEAVFCVTESFDQSLRIRCTHLRYHNTGRNPRERRLAFDTCSAHPCARVESKEGSRSVQSSRSEANRSSDVPCVPFLPEYSELRLSCRVNQEEAYSTPVVGEQEALGFEVHVHHPRTLVRTLHVPPPTFLREGPQKKCVPLSPPSINQEFISAHHLS